MSLMHAQAAADRERARDLAARFESEAAHLRELLARLEWKGWTVGTGCCPVCRRWEGEPHVPDCWLDAELRRDRTETAS